MMKDIKKHYMVALKAVNTTFGTIGGQDYNYANAVIDEEIGEVMNLKL
eukprot:CAMPEP_0170812732 /NCGR_PEP_ID=MMETSP0733-20121128/36253_1 /TAXON_ID=186038 /ORGANISM="Fragilariopsis kerguelensis, Strain L26-C5" /LENGTH=47 /DNA_ID= /DNA_START= /DNA_END= /DNA_ORIENTATION=